MFCPTLNSTIRCLPRKKKRVLFMFHIHTSVLMNERQSPVVKGNRLKLQRVHVISTFVTLSKQPINPCQLFTRKNQRSQRSITAVKCTLKNWFFHCRRQESHLAMQHAVETDYWQLGRWSSLGFSWVAKQKQAMQAICFITFSESLRRPRNKKDCQFKESLRCKYFLSHKQLKSVQK